MCDFKSRLSNEVSELKSKINKLSSFMESKEFYNVSAYQRGLLEVQLKCVSPYLEVLKLRYDDIVKK